MLAFALSIGVYCFWMFLGAGLLSEYAAIS